MARLYGVGKNLILPYTPFGGGKPVSGIYTPPVPATRSKPKQPGKLALATSGTAASRAAQEKVRLRRIENAKRFAPSPVTKRWVAPTVSPGTRARLIGEVSEPAYPVTKNPYDTDTKPTKRRVLKSAPPENTPNITIETVKEVYPLKEPVDAARETAYGEGKVLKAGVNPIRSKYMDINIAENKQRTARITRMAAPVSQSFDRRELEAQWKSNDYETRAQKAAKKRIESARVRAASAAVDRVFPRPSSAPGFEYPSDQPSQTAIDIKAEENRRKVFEDRALRIKEARVRGGSPVYGPKPQPVRVPRPVVRKSNEQIKIDAEKSAAASSGATTYRYPPTPAPYTPGPTIVKDANKAPVIEAPTSSTTFGVGSQSDIRTPGPPSLAELEKLSETQMRDNTPENRKAVRDASHARYDWYHTNRVAEEKTPAGQARLAADKAENKTRAKLAGERVAARRARVARMSTNINNARAKLASNPVLTRLGKGVGKTKGPVITNPVDLLAEYSAAGRAARLAKAQARSTSTAFLRSKSIAPFPGTAGRPNLPMSY